MVIPAETLHHPKACPRGRWLRRATVCVVAGGFSVVVVAALLFLADYQIAGNGSSSPTRRAQWVLNYGDHLHYAVHLVAGRILDLCPCTQGAALAQYYRGRFHALTPNQRAALDVIRPRTAAEWISYFVTPVQVGLDWVRDGVAWLRGDRPVLFAEVDLNDSLEIDNPEVTVQRGATVRWRNTGRFVYEVKSENSRLFDSLLWPQETFSFTFTERGRFSYITVVTKDNFQVAVSSRAIVVH